MAITIKHAKTDNITDWTQTDLDAQIALGNFPPGTKLTDIVLPSDWNNDHTFTGTLGVSNGGTGVTTSSGANSVVLRDANGNITTNCLFEGFTSQANGSLITLTASSVQNWVITGSGGQTIKLPDATTLPSGALFTFNNNQSSGTIVVQNNSGTTIDTLQSGSFSTVVLLNNSTAAGSWDKHDQAPANVSWSTNTFDYAGSITSATWNGNAIALNRGGTNANLTAVNGGAVYSTGTALAISAAGTSGQVLTSSGAGAPTWTTPTTGTVTSVTGTAPVVSSGGATPAISMAAASSTVNGYLTSTDWTTFNSKGSGTVTSVSATSPVTSTGGATPTIAIPAATTSVSGYLTSTDWTTFNNKGSGTVTSVSGTTGRITSTGGNTPVIDLASGVATAGTTGSSTLIPVVTIDTYGRVTSITTASNPQGTVTSVTGTAPVVSSGGATPAISMAAANTTTNGYLTSTDWNTFNGKGSGTVTSVAALTLGTTGTDLSSTVATGTTTPVITLNVPTASASNRGVLSSADWTTFNGKGSGTVTSASVVSANGFAGTVATSTTTPAITLTTTITGLLKGNATAISAATSGTDYSAGTSALTTGILKSTTTTGALSIAVAADFPTLNQNTTGSAATFTSTTQNSQFNSIGVGTAGSTTAGEIRATNNVTAYYSDARLKDFKGTIPNALAKVQALNGYYFTENAKAKELGYTNNKLQVGVSAQEVEAVLPEIVTEAPISAEYKTVYYDKLVPLLIEAIKELSEKVKVLESK
jgi:hypothetical protein